MAEIYPWPSTSIPCPLVDGYVDAGDDGVIRTTVQSGPQRARARVSAVPAQVTAVVMVRRAGMQVLEDFYFLTLRRVGRFYWRDFRKPAADDNVAVYRFAARPSYAPTSSPEFWKATMQLERLTTVNGHFLLDFYDDTTWPTT